MGCGDAETWSRSEIQRKRLMLNPPGGIWVGLYQRDGVSARTGARLGFGDEPSQVEASEGSAGQAQTRQEASRHSLGFTQSAQIFTPLPPGTFWLGAIGGCGLQHCCPAASRAAGSHPEPSAQASEWCWSSWTTYRSRCRSSEVQPISVSMLRRYVYETRSRVM